MELKPCPFCGIKPVVIVCDDEGNFPKEQGYEQNPWSGLGFILYHDIEDAPHCPIATHQYEATGVFIYGSREEAAAAWNRRAE